VIGLVRQPDVQRRPIRVAVHRYAAHSHFAAGAEYAQGNFAAIRNQDFSEHCRVNR
jgi:hypothetical protein